MKFRIVKLPKRTRGKGLKKEVWYSLCSAHGEYQEDCKLCNAGYWDRVYKVTLEHILYKVSWKAWFRYMNGHWPDGNYKDYTE